jgi:hypothetical protein
MSGQVEILLFFENIANAVLKMLFAGIFRRMKNSRIFNNTNPLHGHADAEPV